jgi:hypothetical protein
MCVLSYTQDGEKRREGGLFSEQVGFIHNDSFFGKKSPNCPQVIQGLCVVLFSPSPGPQVLPHPSTQRVIPGFRKAREHRERLLSSIHGIQENSVFMSPGSRMLRKSKLKLRFSKLRDDAFLCG